MTLACTIPTRQELRFVIMILGQHLPQRGAIPDLILGGSGNRQARGRSQQVQHRRAVMGRLGQHIAADDGCDIG